MTGWSIKNTDDTYTPLNFTQPVTTGTTGTTHNIYAQFEEVYYILFIDNNNRVIHTMSVTNGATVTSGEFPSFVTGGGTGIGGWYNHSSHTGSAVTSVAINNEDVNLYAEVVNGYWVTFDSTGGSYVNPVFVLPNDSITAPSNPTRTGYTFSHWSAKENSTADEDKYNFDTDVTEDLILYAVWTPCTVEYTVVHMWENADDENYSFHESETKTGTSGTNTAATAKSYEGFTAKTIDQVTISGEGDTIVYVYYDRNEYSILSYSNENSCGMEEHQHSRWSCYNRGQLICTRVEHTHSDACRTALHTITAKYDANISD